MISPKPPSVSFFLVSAQRLNGSAPDLQDVNGRSSRQRRRHAKSRQGCSGCKRRRVKCDETLPACRNCRKREESCSLQESHLSLEVVPSQSNKFLGLSPDVNLYQMKLFHTFATRTAPTLIFGAELWRNGIMPQSFHYDYLMHAILLISATHLHQLEPDDPRNSRASVIHLSKTLRLFRETLSNPITFDNADAIMATTILLYHHAWTNLNFSTSAFPASAANECDSLSCLDLSMDPIFTLSAGLKEVFVLSQQFLTMDGSIWLASPVNPSTLPIFEAARRCTKAPDRFQKYLERYSKGIEDPLSATASGTSKRSIVERMILTANKDEAAGWFDLIALSEPTEDTSTEDREILTVYMQASRLLAPLSSICRPPNPETRTLMLPEPRLALSTKPMHDGIYSAMAVYLFSFPVRSEVAFNAMVRNNDSRAYMVLLYFYRGVKSLLSADTYWWCRPRAEFMEKALIRSLKGLGFGEILDAEEHAFNAGEVTWSRSVGEEMRKAGSPCFFQKLWTKTGGFDD